MRPRLHVESPLQLLAWIALGAVGAAAVAIGFPRVFPFTPSESSLTRNEAISIALGRLEDFGEPVAGAYVVASFGTDPMLEARLYRAQAARGGSQLAGTRLTGRLSRWTIWVYPPGAGPNDWHYRAEVTPAGAVMALQRAPPRDLPAPDDASGLDAAEARARADRFLREQGFDLALYDSPSHRRVELVGRRDLALRYRDRESALEEDLDYGVEVRFAGNELSGFYSWIDDPRPEEVAPVLRQNQLLQTFWIFSTFLILPPVTVIFVRRYHEGLIGVSRGVQIFLLILGALTLVLLFTLRSSVQGSSFGTLSRQQMTWVWAGMLIFIYFPTVAVLGFFGWSVGESLCGERWRRKLAAFDSLLSGRFNNATVASASLRGVSLGLLKAGLLLAFALLLGRFGAWSPYSPLHGPWWENAAWPGVALVLVAFAYTLGQGLFALVLLLPLLVGRLGLVLGAVLVTIFIACFFFPTLYTFPVTAGAVVWLLSAAFGVVVFLLWDLLSALLASLMAQATVAAVPLLTAEDPFLQFQGWLALLLPALPLWLSVRHLQSERRVLYRHEDVPPHVRRIAARERQRVELETARRIQSSILPELPDRLAGIEIAHTYLPASEVGGDFYDVLALEDGRLSVAIGDVAGHGVSSGLIMSMARSALLVQVTYRPEVEAVFDVLNRVVYQSARKRLLTTLCYAILEPQRRRLLYGSAGHLYPYRVQPGGEVSALESVAYPLGVRESLVVRPRACDLGAGDSIFLASDGLVEARAEGSEEPFGFERLEWSLSRHAGVGARRLRDGVLTDLDRFAGDGHTAPESDVREDDLTILVLTLP